MFLNESCEGTSIMFRSQVYDMNSYLSDMKTLTLTDCKDLFVNW